MGRAVGFEPTHIGTTIRGLNRLTMPAIKPFCGKRKKERFSYVELSDKIKKLSIFLKNTGRCGVSENIRKRNKVIGYNSVDYRQNPQ